MTVRKTVLLALATCVLVLAGASMASAEIVYLTSGRTLSVKDHTEDGDSVTLQLRSGGNVTCDKSLIEKIVPDEVPHPDPAAIAAAAAAAQKPTAPAPTRSAQLRTTAYSDLITNTAQTYGVDPILVQALIQVESNYHPRARSSKGAMGLMQLMPSVAKEYNVRNAYDPAANISAGVQKLKGLLDKWGGDVRMALAAYNAGDGAVAKFNGIPPYRETQGYVSRILGLAGLR
jgi:soluble lytic murein transglycosylase-like protein